MKSNHFTMVARNAVKNITADLDSKYTVGVGFSGGADSTALIFALSTLWSNRESRKVHVVIVDHQLQQETAHVAQRASYLAQSFGFITHIIPVDVKTGGHGAEGDARTSRYDAFNEIIDHHSIKAFLLGHTKTDQAEQVFLSMLRGSGAKSLAGIPEVRGVFRRPFLNHLSRQETQAVCDENNATYWNDPHNDSPQYKRVSVRQLIANTEEATGQNIVNPLVKTASIYAEDSLALDFYTDKMLESVDTTYDKKTCFYHKAHNYNDVLGNYGAWCVNEVKNYPASVRKRAYKRKAALCGVQSDSLTFEKLNRVDELITSWHGQGEIALSRNIVVYRSTQHLYWSKTTTQN